MKKSTIAILLIGLMAVCFAFNVTAEGSLYDVRGMSDVTLAAGDLPVNNESYDVIFASGDHGWGERIYQKGLLQLRSRALTETWGDPSLPVSSMSAYAYAKIKNANNGAVKEYTNSVLDSNRYCDACTAYIFGKATHLFHISTLKVNGVLNWTEDEGTYLWPQ